MDRIGKSIIMGFARTIDTGMILNKYPDIYSAGINDYNAIRSDWCNVGKSIKEATEKYAKARAS